jgi:hypothetical protein
VSKPQAVRNQQFCGGGVKCITHLGKVLCLTGVAGMLLSSVCK